MAGALLPDSAQLFPPKIAKSERTLAHYFSETLKSISETEK